MLSRGLLSNELLQVLCDLYSYFIKFQLFILVVKSLRKELAVKPQSFTFTLSFLGRIKRHNVSIFLTSEVLEGRLCCLWTEPGEAPCLYAKLS